MPLLTLTTWPAISDAGLQRAIAQELCDHTERLLGKVRELTALRFMAEPVGWHIGGEVPTQRSFALDILVTAGTNTEAEKAAWIAAAWDTLRKTLPGEPAPASYIRVQEIAASDWGWGGRTQAARRIEAKAASPADMPASSGASMAT